MEKNILGKCLTTDELLDAAEWENLVRELMFEVIGTAQKLGLKISEEAAENQIKRTRDMGAYKASTPIDFERNAPLELEALFNKPLRQAQQIGVATPRLEKLCEVLKQVAELRSGAV